MAHSSLLDVRSFLDDAQDTEMFDFVIPRIPRANGNYSRAMTVLCQQAVYPGRGNEIMEVPLHGNNVHVSGRATMPRTLSIVYAEHASMKVTNTLQNWFEAQRGTISGTAAGYKRFYAVDGPTLIKYDVTGRIADQVVFYGLQPEDMPDAQLDGSSTNLYTVNMSFRYDFYVPRNVSLR